MRKEEEILAWRKFPEPNGMLYIEEDLSERNSVVQLFNYCKTSEAYINSDGWKYLFDFYGMNELLQIDTESKWSDIEGQFDQMKELIYHSLIAGYNPIIKEKGDYDEESGDFFTLDGYKTKFDWDNIGSSALS